MPGATEELARIKKCYDSMVSNAFALSPPYQHLIQCVKARHLYNGEPKMSSAARAILVGLVKHLYRGGDDAAEEMVKSHCGSWQHVRIVNGVMSIVDRNMEGVHGFSGHINRKQNKVKAASIVPHFGLPKFEWAVSLIDNVLQRPGYIHWLEDCVMYGSGFRTARIMLVARIESEHDMSFVAGWVFK